MSAADAAALAALPHWAFGFVLALARVSAAVMLLPGLGEAELPAMVRAGIAVAITILLLPALAPLMPPTPADPLHLAAMVCADIATGLWLGWLARLTVQALAMGGQFIAYMLGLSNVLQPDPILGSQATPISSLLGIAAPLTVLVSGLYALPLMALAGSYGLIPAGSMLPAADSTEVAVRAVGAAFGIAVRLASPFILVGILWHVATGLLARLVPRLQVYFIVMPAQLLGGMLLLAVLMTALLSAWEESTRSGFASLPGS